MNNIEQIANDLKAAVGLLQHAAGKLIETERPTQPNPSVSPPDGFVLAELEMRHAKRGEWCWNGSVKSKPFLFQGVEHAETRALHWILCEATADPTSKAINECIQRTPHTNGDLRVGGPLYPEHPPDPPFGYEFTGEFRHARWEWFYWYGTAQRSESSGTATPVWILRPLPVRPDKPPEGFEFATETKRQVVYGEWYWSGDPGIGPMNWPRGKPTPDRFWILRKLPTITDTYGRDPTEHRAPEGYEWLIEKNYRPVFRLLLEGDEYLMAGGSGLDVGHAKNSDTGNGPRLILRRKPKPPTIESVPKPRRHVFEETGEERPAQQEDWFLNYEGSLVLWDSPARSMGTYKILRLVEKPE